MLKLSEKPVFCKFYFLKTFQKNYILKGIQNTGPNLSSGSTDEITLAVAAAKSLQSCPTLCDPMDGSPPGSAIPGILQARTLEWVAISFSSA